MIIDIAQPAPKKIDKTIYEPPAKYNQLVSTHRQIPFSNIKELVFMMDQAFFFYFFKIFLFYLCFQDADCKVTLEDILNFSHKNFIFLKDEVAYYLTIFIYLFFKKIGL